MPISQVAHTGGHHRIHPTAVIDPQAKLADDLIVGAYSVIGPDVTIGPGCRVGSHAVITGHTRIGSGNTIYHFVSLGEAPQDKKYGNEPTRLEIGDNNTIREFCTFNRGTVQDAGVTRLGNDNWLMAYVHLAHDCQVGDHTVFANNAQLAGHVHVGDFAILGGFTVVHQFCRIGAHSLTAMGSIVLKDIPPYVTASGNPVRPYGINAEGLKRRGFSADAIGEIRRVYKTVYMSGLTLEQARADVEPRTAAYPELRVLADFLAVPGRGIVR